MIRQPVWRVLRSPELGKEEPVSPFQSPISGLFWLLVFEAGRGSFKSSLNQSRQGQVYSLATLALGERGCRTVIPRATGGLARTSWLYGL